jgi:diadenosine tetraphosphate (Ap4A) HIT family hydrolase
VIASTWPADWDDRRAGVNCPTCAQGRPDETRGGLRFFAGDLVDAYLRKSAPQPGYAVTVWRGRHVPDPVDLNRGELAAYWTEVATAARALYEVYQPAQLNYLTYGNNVPHLHTYLVCRYVDDPAPGLPLAPFVERPVDIVELRRRVAQLQSAVGR